MIHKALPLLLFAPLPAAAVILTGQLGTGTGTTTSSSLNSFISSNALPAFPYWANVIQVSDASGIYLGASGDYGWVLTAAHVTQLGVNAGTITVNGTPYTVRQNVGFGSPDFRLYRIGGATGDPALPAIPNIPLDATSNGAGLGFLTFGRGGRVEGTLGSATSSDIQLGSNATYFEWAGAGSMRWGTNVTSTLPAWAGPAVSLATVNNTVSFFSLFDDPGSGNYLGATEGGLSLGDSGGPAFTLDSGTWKLSGWNMAVASNPSLSQPGSTLGFGNLNIYGNIATYKTTIEAAMVPEPSVSLTALAAAGMLLLQRRGNSRRATDA